MPTLLPLFLFALMFNGLFAERNLRKRDISISFANNTNSNSDSENWKHFTEYKEKFSKKYSSWEELNERFKIFANNLKTIRLHNADPTQNFTMGLNQFSDLTVEEFKTTFVGGLKPKTSVFRCGSYANANGTAPSSVDWIKNGAVSSVKDQGQCGSCWTFSSTGAIEGAWAIAKGQLLDLSEQQLVDCATGLPYTSRGCNGGEMDDAFKYVMQNGQCSAGSYPYSAKSSNCLKCYPVAHITGCYDVKPNDQNSLKSAVSLNPVSVAISADTKIFQSYSGGVITSSSCYTSLDHGVLIVGYGNENGIDYWNVKNSWGNTWGENGYVKIGRSSSDNDAGICGIAMDPSFPVV